MDHGRVGAGRWLALALTASCAVTSSPFEADPGDTLPVVDDSGGDSGEAPTVFAPLDPAPAGLRTLTPDQYVASVKAVLGPAGVDAPVPAIGAWASSVAAARGGIPALTVDQYEGAARAVSDWAVADVDRRAALFGCTPTDTLGDPCVDAVLDGWLTRAFRRAPTDDERQRWVAVVDGASTAVDGLQLALYGLLQAPSFLYRVELGTPVEEAPGRFVYTADERATRLAYLIWGGPPDEALLALAADGTLDDPTGLTDAVDAMLDDPRADVGLEALLHELLQVDGLHELEKDPIDFPDFADQRDGLAAQLVATAAEAVREGRVGDLFTTDALAVDAATAPLYGLSAEDAATGWVSMPPERAGILTTAGFLALHAYPGKTSPALRGLFVRKQLLCFDIPPPPADVVTVLPPRGTALLTTRQLVAIHQTSPSCAGCHAHMDPIGLALETFDAVGQHRTTEHDQPIDPSGELDGVPFDDALGLGVALAEHPEMPSCVASHVVARANGSTVDHLHPDVEALAADDTMRAILRAVATSELFLNASLVEEDAP